MFEKINEGIQMGAKRGLNKAGRILDKVGEVEDKIWDKILRMEPEEGVNPGYVKTLKNLSDADLIKAYEDCQFGVSVLIKERDKDRPTRPKSDSEDIKRRIVNTFSYLDIIGRELGKRGLDRPTLEDYESRGDKATKKFKLPI